MLLVVALVLAATRVMAAQGHDVQTPPPTPVLTPAASATTSATPSPASLRVHVFGAVASPGVVTLSAGARVADAIEASGGLVLEADCGELNLAAPVQDGSQIIVGTKDNAGKTITREAIDEYLNPWSMTLPGGEGSAGG